jgi:DNA-binding FrmR family transcriptional regulator
MFSISSFNSASSYDVSSESYQKFLQKQLDQAKKNAAAIDGLSRRADMDQKSWARQRVEEIKKEIEALQKMLLLFGGKDAKALLQQLKQLASQLKQAANILQAPSESSVPDAAAAPSEQGAAAAQSTEPTVSSTASTSTVSADAHAEGRNAYAAQQASADADAVRLPATGFDAQRAEDEKQLDLVSRALRSLRATAEKMAKQQDAADRRQSPI